MLKAIWRWPGGDTEIDPRDEWNNFYQAIDEDDIEEIKKWS